LRKHPPPKTEGELRVFVAYATKAMVREASTLASRLRWGGISTEVEILDRGLRQQLERASALGAAYTVIVAPREMQEGKVVLKDMKQGLEEAVPLSEVVDRVRGSHP
jgi:histidyl-tRNA synthetase